eukprot:1275039-Rhodomonas_salina.3
MNYSLQLFFCISVVVMVGLLEVCSAMVVIAHLWMVMRVGVMGVVGCVVSGQCGNLCSLRLGSLDLFIVVGCCPSGILILSNFFPRFEENVESLIEVRKMVSVSAGEIAYGCAKLMLCLSSSHRVSSRRMACLDVLQNVEDCIGVAVLVLSRGSEGRDIASGLCVPIRGGRRGRSWSLS